MNKLYTLLFLVIALLLIKKFLPILINGLLSKNFTNEAPSIVSSKYLSTVSLKSFISYCIKAIDILGYYDIVQFEKKDSSCLIAYKNNIKYLVYCQQNTSEQTSNEISPSTIDSLIGLAYLNECNNILIISNKAIDKTSLEGKFPFNYLIEIIDGESMFSTLNPNIFIENEVNYLE